MSSQAKFYAYRANRMRRSDLDRMFPDLYEEQERDEIRMAIATLFDIPIPDPDLYGICISDRDEIRVTAASLTYTPICSDEHELREQRDGQSPTERYSAPLPLCDVCQRHAHIRRPCVKCNALICFWCWDQNHSASYPQCLDEAACLRRVPAQRRPAELEPRGSIRIPDRPVALWLDSSWLEGTCGNCKAPRRALQACEFCTGLICEKCDAGNPDKRIQCGSKSTCLDRKYWNSVGVTPPHLRTAPEPPYTIAPGQERQKASWQALYEAMRKAERP